MVPMMPSEYLSSSPGDVVSPYVVEMSTEVDLLHPPGVSDDLYEITVLKSSSSSVDLFPLS